MLLLMPITVLVGYQAQGEPVELPADSPSKGKTIYEQACKWCHGGSGAGDGPAGFFTGPYSSPRARDFTVGNFRFRSTESGELPTDQDLRRVITRGIPGYMPSFAGLPRQAVDDVIRYLKTFIPDMVEGVQPLQMTIENLSIPPTPDSIRKGREAYFEFTCNECHGNSGRGKTSGANVAKLLDNTLLPITPTDLTNRFAFKNGWSTRDIVRTLMTGLDGTPMPSFANEFQPRIADAWHMANFIRSLSSDP